MSEYVKHVLMLLGHLIDIDVLLIVDVEVTKVYQV